MQLEEAMRELNMDIEGTLARFSGNGALLERFIRKFAQDTTFQDLKQGVSENDWKKMEISAHTLKGVAGNLGFSRLFQEATGMVADIRADRKEKALEDYRMVEEAYDEVIGVIARLD